MRALIIGGTRNLGPSIVQAFLERGMDISIFNRGQTPDDLPGHISRFRGDRGDPVQLKSAVGSHKFHAVIDTTLYAGPEAQAAVEVFSGRVQRYIFLSTGQVYLLRLGVKRPFKESDYGGPVMAEPPRDHRIDYQNWLYGHDKRQAEDVFAAAWANSRFPFTSLRLPMVHSERDHYHRILGYVRRLQDGGPILLPEGSGLPVQHVYGEDVVQAILRLLETDKGKGEAYNIGQDESVSLDQFLQMLAGSIHEPLKILRVPREKLERAGLRRIVHHLAVAGCPHWITPAASQNWAWNTRHCQSTWRNWLNPLVVGLVATSQDTHDVKRNWSLPVRLVRNKALGIS